MVKSQVQNIIKNELTAYFHDKWKYLQVDTSTTMPAGDAVELINGGTQIGNSASLYNKERDLNAPYTQRINNTSIMQFSLSTLEPYVQPMNIGSIGLMSQATEGAGLGIPVTFPITITKSNQSQWKIRAEFKIITPEEI